MLLVPVLLVLLLHLGTSAGVTIFYLLSLISCSFIYLFICMFISFCFRGDGELSYLKKGSAKAKGEHRSPFAASCLLRLLCLLLLLHLVFLLLLTPVTAALTLAAGIWFLLLIIGLCS